MPARSVFEDVVVVEVATGSIAASVAGMILADNGARVVKIEPPRAGDRLRDGNPSGSLVWNRGKESLVLDLGTADGRDALRSAAAAADVVIDALHPGTMRAWQLERDDLSVGNDRLVYCAIRGFDENGPYHHLRAYEGVVAAKVGMFNHGLWGYRDGPIFLNAPVLSVSAAHLALGSISAALIARESTGVGDRVEVSMFTAAGSYDYGLTPSFQHRMRHNPDNVNHPKAGGATRGIVHGCSADDRWFAFMNLLPYQSRALVTAVGLGAMLDDETFAGAPYFATPEIAEDYEVAVMEALRRLDGDEIVARMLDNPDVGFEEIRTTAGAFDHPQVRHNGSAIDVDDPRLGLVRQVAPLCDFAGTPSRILASAPALGGNRLGVAPLRPRREPMGDATATATEGGPRRAAPLAGMTIIEAGYFFAMPYGLTLAASLGARVIKIEGPTGDPWRMLATSEPEVFASQCLQGKESVAIDFKAPEGLEVVRRLVAQADAFVYSLRQDPRELGLGDDDLRAVNPDLVYVERPGYGIDGPYAGRPMYAHTADAVSGMYMRDAELWLRPEMSKGASVMELKAIQVERMVTDRMYADGHGANAVFSTVLMALLAKRRFGIGQKVSGSMLHAALFGLADEFVDADERWDFARSDPEQMGLDALYRLYRVMGGWVFLAAPTDASWAALVDVLDRADLARDERFQTRDGRRAHDAVVASEIGAVLAARDPLYWERELSARGVGCAAVSELQLQGFTSLDAGLRQSGLTTEVEHPTLGTMVRAAAAATFASMPVRIAPGSIHGQDTEAVLRELGYTEDEIDDLAARGVAYRSG